MCSTYQVFISRSGSEFLIIDLTFWFRSIPGYKALVLPFVTRMHSS